MKITYFGHSCFLLQSKDGVRVLTDPYTKVGYELPERIRADIVTVSHGHFDHNYLAAVESGAKILNQAGAYNVCGLSFIGQESAHDPVGGKMRGKNIIFKTEIDGVVVCHLGDLGEELSAQILQKIDKVDVLLLPVGGTYTIDAAQAKAYVAAIRPKIVIPMHYRPTDGTLDIATEKAFLEGFEVIRPLEKYQTEIEKDGLKTEETQIIFLERKK